LAVDEAFTGTDEAVIRLVWGYVAVIGLEQCPVGGTVVNLQGNGVILAFSLQGP
jgi:hypothetical protein